jgi:two-component sensor histidine kinase
VLVEEFAHRVLNEYAQAIAGLNLAARRTDNETARRHLTDAADRLYAHAHAHRALAMPAADAHCDFADYIARVCSAIANARLPNGGLRLNLDLRNAVLSSDRCWRLALIVAELIHNAARHGCRDSEVLVELSADDSHLFCRVSNGGACAPVSNLGRGRRVVLALAEELGGQADWLFTPTGAWAWVVVPLDAASAPDLQ